MKKITIFLGAGASASEGAPIQTNLFKEYFNYIRSSSTSIDIHYKRYFKKFWNIDVENDDIDNCIFPTFEEALGILELAKNRQEGFHEFYNIANSNAIDHTIEDLIFLIAEILDFKLNKSNKYHSILLTNILEKDLFTKVNFVSLNYDILIDNAITTLYPNFDLDYGIDFINFEMAKSWKRPRINKSISLFKIHGSLNWLYCSVCKQILLTPKLKGVSQLIRRDGTSPYECPHCKGTFSPILIPPTFFKVMSNPYLNRIWDLAEKSLAESEKIIFCGYSLPDADMHIKYLLKRACINRVLEQPKIIVINNHKNKTDILKDEEKYRYTRLFGKGVDYTNFSFEEFAKNLYEII